MDTTIIGIGAVTGNSPTTREECQQRLLEIHNDIAAIRTEIATADLERQARRGRINPTAFLNMKGRLRTLQAQAAEVSVRMSRLPGRKDALKEMLIVLFRERHDDAAWAVVLDEAHRRLGEVA